jgi:pentatricopeptide repeat protein
VVSEHAAMLARGGRPDEYTFPSLLKAVSPAANRVSILSAAAAVHAHAVKFGLERNDHVSSALVLAYAAGRDGVAARAVLEGETAAAASPVAWNALISGHNRARQFGLSRRSFADMVRAGVAPTPVTFVAVLSACGKARDALLGAQLHKRSLDRGLLPDLKVGNALVDMYARVRGHGCSMEVVRRHGNKGRGVVDVTGFWVCEVRPGRSSLGSVRLYA